ncbi:MAG: glutamate synthase large subunit [Planctomycetota bacterium]
MMKVPGQTHPRRAARLHDPEFERGACGVGFVANIDGRRSHDIIEKGVEILVNLAHRGAAASDPETGDGAGLLLQLPDRFLRFVCSDTGLELPEIGGYAVAVVFLPKKPAAQRECVERVEHECRRLDCAVVGWRNVPVNEDVLGRAARESAPSIKQLFVRNPGLDPQGFERRLYVVRRSIEKELAAFGLYIPSFSARTVCYKGLMLAHQVPAFYPDLTHDAMETALAVVHQRYSTNTFPTWPLAQPCRLGAHNGEINTLRGNVNNMRARCATLVASPAAGFTREQMEAVLPVVAEGGSDSACFDNVLELLVMAGRSVPHAMMMMVPEAWGVKYYMGADRRAFYEYHSMFMEPWDGPAAMVATDGVVVCATLDRNGLRPGRYTVTRDGLVILASEAGVLDVPPREVQSKGRVSPGKMIMVDTARGRFLDDEEVKAAVCRRRPYRRWLEANRVELRGLFDGDNAAVEPDSRNLLERQQAFGYTREDLNLVIAPMCADAHEPVGSMGDDTPLAALSDKPQLLFNYFKQLFAQVTNPAIDPIREDLVMPLTTYLGRQGNLLDERPEHARMLKLRTPILTNEDLVRIRGAGAAEFKGATLEMLFNERDGADGLEAAVRSICEQAETLVRGGSSVLILSDRGMSARKAPVPSLLAAAAVNRHLVREGIRTQASIVIESGEPREVMHFALLLGYGTSAVNPYLALETTAALAADGGVREPAAVLDAVENYIKATEKGLLKVLSKMGISTLRSYRGAQIFEALGLAPAFVQEYFPGTSSRIGGLGIAEVARETLERHGNACRTRQVGPRILPSGGRYRVRHDGERHLWTPDAIRFLQRAARQNDAGSYARFAEWVNNQDGRHCTLRSLFDFARSNPVPVHEVEPTWEIIKRFVTGAMSFGSLSPEAHETIALAMNQMGTRSNSGEGGEDPGRYIPGPKGGNRSSATKQVASGRFGVTAEYLVNATELQIKIAQGAKPGEGGQLPGHKVNVQVAAVRHATPGVSLISPPPHHDIYSIEDLSQLIFDLKNVNPFARINVKLVSEAGVGAVAAGVAKAHADAILVSGGGGGTGASPLSSIKHAGVPWELGLAEVQQVLVENNLRGRVRLQVDGQMRTGRDAAVAALLGAEEFGFGTAPLVCLGCLMMRKCHEDACPVGVATQDPRLRRRFSGRPAYLVNYFHFVADEMSRIMAQLGFRTVDEMVGRSDLLVPRDGITHWKARTLDLGAILTRPRAKAGAPLRQIQRQEHGLGGVLDRKLIELAAPALQRGTRVKVYPPRQAEFAIRNTDRATGTMLSGEIARRLGHRGLPDDTLVLRFRGSAGQSFGAFAARGLTLVLEGEANDYVGKSLSGAKIIVRPPADAAFEPARNVIIGNVALYGATAGEAYVAGLAGERFAVRNSGALAVVEGLGDHGCEYMTGGVVAVLGRTGVNFAAGMSGGIAYVHDPLQDFDLRCNLDMVDLEPVQESDDVALLRRMLERHVEHTGSARARWMLDCWDRTLSLFVKVMPVEYRRALGQTAKREADERRTEREVIEVG